ncbi:hypothetical protein FRB90_001533, partial [Tulasnella sp. 427]
MSSSNPPEPTVAEPAVTPPAGDQPKPEIVTKPKKRCQYYRSPQGCFKGDACNFSHERPRSNGSPPKSNSSPPNGTANGSPPEAQSPKPKQFYKKPNKFRKGRGPLSPEQVKQQALAQSAAAKAENAKKVTIYSEDDEQSWTLDREFLSSRSKPMDQVLAYTRTKADEGAKDPIANIRGLLRFGDGLENLQLDDVKSDDFDVFLTALRASDDAEVTFQDLRTILTLASDWGFDDLRHRCIRQIEKIPTVSAVDKAVLARRCKISKWIRGALLSLTVLPDPLTAAEIQILGTMTSALIWRAREEVFLHRVQALTIGEKSKCTGTACKQVRRDALLRVLERSGTAGKSETDLVELVQQELSTSEAADKDKFCENCKSEEG